MSKLIGGPGDGKDMGDFKGSSLQWAAPFGEKPLMYHRLKLVSLWPIPGWDFMCVDTGDLSRGVENRYQVFWQKKGWFSPDRIDEIGEYLKMFHFMDEVMLAYSCGDGGTVDILLPRATAEAEHFAEITNPQRKDSHDQG
jgi:hypothetical protein